jgi:hypothetical protein
VKRIGFLLIMAPALSASGCWYAALQYAPIALQTTVGAASTIAGASQGSKHNTPGVIELRDDSSGSPEYREMRVAFTATDIRWTPVVDRDTAADGWRPAENFLQMNFTPPLTAALAGDKIVYLAYAPAYTGVPEDNDQLIKFNRSFGNPVGTFDWKGHVYQYSLPQALPPLEFD